MGWVYFVFVLTSSEHPQCQAPRPTLVVGTEGSSRTSRKSRKKWEGKKSMEKYDNKKVGKRMKRYGKTGKRYGKVGKGMKKCEKVRESSRKKMKR